MSYNLLLDTNFQKINSRWKLTNCSYDNGYLIGASKLYSIEQSITIPDITKLYFSLDYICLDPNIENVWVGIQSDSLLEINKQSPKIHKRVRLSVITIPKTETISVKFIIEAKEDASKIYIDSPLLVDLECLGKEYLPKFYLDKYLKFRHGYIYSNEYKENELTLNNGDFKNGFLVLSKAKVGIMATLKSGDAFSNMECNLKEGSYYLVKLDYKEVNKYGQIYFKYGEIISEPLGEEQLYILFKASANHNLQLYITNHAELNYSINLKHLLLINIDELNIDLLDIPHIPFVEN